MKKNISLLILFLVLLYLIHFVLHHFREEGIKDYLNTKTLNFQRSHDVMNHEYKTIASIIYKTNINVDSVLKIFKDAKSSNAKSKDIIRKKLYKQLRRTYHLVKENHLKLLHFHLPDNKSFLRFHKIDRYGDDLTNIRETIRYVNKEKKQIDGFEIGRVYSGYRFVFPLFYKNGYLGSVELSFDANIITKEFENHYEVKSILLESKEIIDKKVFNKEKYKYQNSLFKNFYVEEKVKIIKKQNISEKTKQIVAQRWAEDESFSIYDSELKKTITFIKVFNPVSNKVVALLQIQSDANYILRTIQKYNWLFVILSFITALTLYLIYKEFRYRIIIESSNKKLSSIFMYAESGIALMDLDGKFLEVNQAYSNLLGYTSKELLNLGCLDISSEQTKEQSEIGLKKARDEGGISKVRKFCISKDAKEVQLEFSLTLLPSKEAFIAVINSIDQRLFLENLNKVLEEKVNTEVQENRKKDEKLLAQSRLAQMGEMLSMIAHQWRQPLGAISGSVISIQTKLALGQLNLGDKEQREEFIEFIEQKHENINEYVLFLSETIDDFRNFFKPDKKKELVSLTTPISRALYITKNSMESKHIKITTDYMCEEKINIYQNEIMQVILNILKNSEDNFIDRDIENRHINITTYSKESTCVITIEDNGGGIFSDLLPKIYDPYFSTKDEKNGTGLGLYMSKMIVQEHHNGSLNSRNIKNGVIFEIILQKEIDV